MDLIPLTQVTNSFGICECGNEHSDSIKCEEFYDWRKTD